MSRTDADSETAQEMSPSRSSEQAAVAQFNASVEGYLAQHISAGSGPES